MDPVTHTLTGAALARAGLRRATPLATATLVIAANAPDIDILAMLRGSYAALAFRRGVTHGPIALLVLPLVVTGLVLWYDRRWRLRRRPDAPPARLIPTFALALLGVLTHPLLDWMNTYGIRLLMPFDRRWFYGDTLFIVDPWIWLALAAPFVLTVRSAAVATAWAAFGIAASTLVLLPDQVALAAKLLWLAAAGAIIVLALRRRRVRAVTNDVDVAADVRGGLSGDGRLARAALAAAALYILLMLGSGRLARAETARTARAAGLDVHDLMVAPAPANPLAADIVVVTADSYHRGRFRWLTRPRVQWTGESIPFGARDQKVFATLQLPQVRDYLRWSRFPYVQVRADSGGHVVRFGDARYPAAMGGGLAGITVYIDASLRARIIEP